MLFGGHNCFTHLAYSLGDLGRTAELILRSWGGNAKHFQGAEEVSFRDLRRSLHYFQGSREHRPPNPRGKGGSIVGQNKSFDQTCPEGWPVLPLAWRDKFSHHDLMISLTEVNPLSYRDIRRGLPGLVPPYCALVEYEGFRELVVIVIRKLYIFACGALAASICIGIVIPSTWLSIYITYC